MCQNGVALVALEHKGHGRSDGLNGLICDQGDVIKEQN